MVRMQARMQSATADRARTSPRPAPSSSSAFDQYLHDIQRLPLIPDVEEERRLARLAQRGGRDAAERLVPANRVTLVYVPRRAAPAAAPSASATP